ncbi:hypothetical protein E2562_002735 [Oryza meyeriana var. granulata]|uniref:Uncharacterized protein n=1 Tax=Oryza meyeriana var. granulata TaxID=110450 RepID=A0A6G1BRE2_9ORYZ|nr:hypothetical protein E2562_002735 [Oryza meyeriana var. granulata]
MALDARAMLPAAEATASAVDVGEKRPWSGNGGGGDSSSPTVAAVSVDLPTMWGDERRMKQELVAWAKAVASMAIRESMQY